MILDVNQVQVVRSDKTILKALSFQVAAGEVYALLGEKGAGKSTTLLSILGFLPCASGCIRVNGLEVTENLAKTRRSIAYLPETPSLHQHLTALENLTYFLRLANVSVSRNKIDEILARVGLVKSVRATPLRDYSNSMHQKVAIALAILRGVDIFLFDEPTFGLNNLAVNELYGLIGDLASEGKTVLMATEYVDSACQVADRIGVLCQGELTSEFCRSNNGECIDPKIVHGSLPSIAIFPTFAANES